MQQFSPQSQFHEKFSRLSKDVELNETDRDDYIMQNISEECQRLLKKFDDQTLERLVDERQFYSKKAKEKDNKLREIYQRKWLTIHGQKYLIDFDDKERSNLQKYFKSLDEDGSAAIGIEELAVPLISIGMAESQEDVKKIIDEVDEDGTQEIEFKEFLDIIKGKSKNRNSASHSVNNSVNKNKIIDFFKDMIKGNIGEKMGVGQISKDLPFPLIISTVRRKKLLDAIMCGDNDRRLKGEKVMNAYRKLEAAKKTQQSNISLGSLKSGSSNVKKSKKLKH